jgi:hypothetical protein
MRIWLFNPFKYIAGSKALLIGWTVMLATAGVAFLSKTQFDGVIDVHGSLPVARAPRGGDSFCHASGD